jgi:hypothetical protein
MVAFPDFQLLDVTGPLEVFGRTARWLVEHGHRTDLAYPTEVLASRAGSLVLSSVARLIADRALTNVQGECGRAARRSSSDDALGLM